MAILLYILLPSILVGILMLMNKSLSGSDHAIHVNTIDRIKRNKHRFLTDYVLCINERNVYYPQLFHWILSFLPEAVYKKKYIYINVTVKFIEIIVFNLFLFFWYGRIQFDTTIFLYANTIIHVFPFTYAVWNAKNSGLSVRGIGLVAGHLYTYFIIAYALTDNFVWLLAILAIIFIIILLSLMAVQYVLLTIPFFVCFFKMFELIPLPFIALALFYLSMPEVAKKYIVGQYNHKRNYALFNAKPFLLAYRPSIYRDFIYDFWIKLRKNFFNGLVYIYFNPIVEIIYGFPFLLFVLYLSLYKGLSNDLEILFFVILSALGAFFLTSLRWTRFLGEPQRYVEFVIPIITLVYVLNFSVSYHIGLILFCVLFILVSSYFLSKNSKVNLKNISRNNFLNFIENETTYMGCIYVSNDNEALKLLSNIGIRIVRSDTSSYFKNKTEYFKNYYKGNLYIHSPVALKSYCENFKPDFLVLNTDFYNIEVLNDTFSPQMNLVKKMDNYELYHLVN